MKEGKINGLIVYEITSGKIIGTYANTDTNFVGEVYGEVAIKNDEKPAEIEGTYNTEWNEKNKPESVKQELRIKLKSKYYSLEWWEKSELIFEGFGLLINGKLVVYYWEA